MAKAMTAEKLQRLQAKREKEIRKWEKEKAKPKKNLYFVYIILVITLIYVTDEVASQIGTLMKTEIANDLFASEGSVGWLDMLSILSAPFMAIGLFYRPLADRWGRKMFLIINTFGMSFGLLFIYLSQNVFLYFVGACAVQFFIPHDMHVVYIMESSPPKHRARIYSIIKFFANMGVMLIPLLRKYLMSDATQWRRIYFIPAVVGVIVCFVALFTARETDSYIDSRLRYLRMTDAEREAEKLAKNEQNVQGGLIPAFKFALKHKQLRWLYITSTLANVGIFATVNYQVVISYGYAQNYVSNGLFSALGEDVLNFVSTGPVTEALMLFPIGSALAQVLMGFVSDSKGRKAAAITTAVNCLVSFVLFSVGSVMAWNPYVVGFLCGAFIGSYYSTNDVIIMMIGESAPTNLRSSAISAQYITCVASYAISYGVGLPLVTLLGNHIMGIVSFALMVPGFAAAFFALVRKTHETKEINVDTVTGCEWD